MAVFVVGSVNVDVALPVAELPAAGATILAGEPIRSGGGKGANAAVAAARAGGDVRLIAAVGDDGEGERSRAELRAEGIDVEGVAVVEGRATGLAMICVDSGGENFVVVAPGANASLTPALVARGLERLTESDVCTVNFEIPEEAVRAAVEIASHRGAPLLVNPSPVRPLAEEMLVDKATLVVNALELRHLTREEDVATGARSLRARGCGQVVVTLGAEGAHLAMADGRESTVPAYPATPVDTTGAGDTFLGVLASALDEGAGLRDAARRGAAAAALATERIGARAAMPGRGAIDRLLAGRSPTVPDAGRPG